MLNGPDLGHLVAYRLRPNRLALGFCLLARNLAIGLQIRAAAARPLPIHEPAAFRAAHIEGLGTFVQEHGIIRITAPRAPQPQIHYLPWTGLTVHLAA